MSVASRTTRDRCRNMKRSNRSTSRPRTTRDRRREHEAIKPVSPTTKNRVRTTNRRSKRTEGPNPWNEPFQRCRWDRGLLKRNRSDGRRLPVDRGHSCDHERREIDVASMKRSSPSLQRRKTEGPDESGRRTEGQNGNKPFQRSDGRPVDRGHSSYLSLKRLFQFLGQ